MAPHMINNALPRSKERETFMFKMILLIKADMNFTTNGLQ